ncbi:protein phosphatase 1 regulatory subunit 14B-like [Panonychus citri]|uniref:protein phosphatase 1 regulatory subunit 14B-like n=1 Tax=Panonychus citri TaxID=50023 RepID=UPI0023082B52|nr:protein phosphatase 1 regulatory subunit 14B-like [Panonychus citri]XP_053200323.1 protein phosphatase 1 regulatory subunit 14B-like [Panonychus citri]
MHQSSVKSSSGSPAPPPPETTSKGAFHVNFNIDQTDITDRKKNYLTAKYGQHQMNLIKKRLRVEMWMCEQLQSLYSNDDGTESNEVEIDLDELLDLEGDDRRKDWLKAKLIGVKKSVLVMEKFIDEVLEKAKTL